MRRCWHRLSRCCNILLKLNGTSDGQWNLDDEIYLHVLCCQIDLTLLLSCRIWPLLPTSQLLMAWDWIMQIPILTMPSPEWVGMLVGCCIVVCHPLSSLHAIVRPLTLSLPAAFAANCCPPPPPPEIVTYYCAVQGSRSVEEFECLNKILLKNLFIFDL